MYKTKRGGNLPDLSAAEFFSAVIKALNENGECANADGKTIQHDSPLAISLNDRH